MNLLSARYHATLWLRASLFCLLFAPALQADDEVAGAVALVAPNEVVFFDGPQYKVGYRKARASYTLAGNKVHAILRPKDLHAGFEFTESLSPSPVRSILLGSDLGLLVRYGRATFVLTRPWPDSDRAVGDFRIFFGGQRDFRGPWNSSYNDFIIYRRKVWPHGPPGAAFCRWNRYNELNSDKWMAHFVLANDLEQFLDVSVSRNRPNLGWVELFGKGTELRMRIKGQGDRSLTAKSDGGGRANTFNLKKVGMSLDDVEWLDANPEDPAPGPGNADLQHPAVMVVQPNAPNWVAGARWVGSPNMGHPGVKVPEPEASTPPQPAPPGLALPTLAGVWRQQAVPPLIPAAKVVIGVSNTKPGQFACRIPTMKIFGVGTLRADRTLEASFGAANSTMTGMKGAPHDKVKGKVAVVDGQNRATRIEWSNGVVYIRIR